MSTARRQHHLTVLADGNVLATGGQSAVTPDGGVDLANAVYAAELYDAAAGTWRTLAAANRVRQSHSTAILLPDGRGMAGGAGICGDASGSATWRRTSRVRHAVAPPGYYMLFVAASKG
jgi:hypothetical protein